MDPITPSDPIIEVTLSELPLVTTELLTSVQIVPLPLALRALPVTEITLNSADGGDTECDDGRPETGMLYPRG